MALAWYSRSLNRNWAASAPQHSAVNVGSAAFSLHGHSTQLNDHANTIARVAATAPWHTAAVQPQVHQHCRCTVLAACFASGGAARQKLHSLCVTGCGIAHILVQDGRYIAVQQPDGSQCDRDLHRGSTEFRLQHCSCTGCAEAVRPPRVLNDNRSAAEAAHCHLKATALTVQASGKGPRLNAQTSYTCAPHHNMLLRTLHRSPQFLLLTSLTDPGVREAKQMMNIDERRSTAACNADNHFHT